MIRANQHWKIMFPIVFGCKQLQTNLSQVPRIANTGARSPGMAPELAPCDGKLLRSRGWAKYCIQRMSCPFNPKIKNSTTSTSDLSFLRDPITLSDDDRGVFFHLLRKVFRFYYFHYYSQKEIGFLGLTTIVLHKKLSRQHQATITYPREREKENHRLESAFKKWYEIS